MLEDRRHYFTTWALNINLRVAPQALAIPAVVLQIFGLSER
ncbi:MAG: hypothetical protein QM736_15435 [Vicinamibacterales bacterium]